LPEASSLLDLTEDRLDDLLSQSISASISPRSSSGNYLHDDDEGKQEAQIKRIKPRAKSAKQEARK
jgi:hypothetical protein